MYQHITHYGIPEYSEQERQFAEEIHATLTKDDLHNAKLNAARSGGEQAIKWGERQGNKALTDEVLPYVESKELMYGSTDVGMSAGSHQRHNALALALHSAHLCIHGNWLRKEEHLSPIKACY